MSTVHCPCRAEAQSTFLLYIFSESREAESVLFPSQCGEALAGMHEFMLFFLSPPPIFGVLNSLSSKKTNECPFECQVTKRNYQHFKHNYTATFNGRSHQDWQPLLNTFLPLQGTWNVQTGYCLIGSMFLCF